MSKYVIQVFRPISEDNPNIGYWSNTAWGGGCRKKTKQIFDDIVYSSNPCYFNRVRLLEVLEESECKWSGWAVPSKEQDAEIEKIAVDPNHELGVIRRIGNKVARLLNREKDK